MEAYLLEWNKVDGQHKRNLQYKCKGQEGSGGGRHQVVLEMKNPCGPWLVWSHLLMPILYLILGKRLNSVEDGAFTRSLLVVVSLCAHKHELFWTVLYVYRFPVHGQDIYKRVI